MRGSDGMQEALFTVTKLEDFIETVSSLPPQVISTADAEALVAAAQKILDVLGGA